MNGNHPNPSDCYSYINCDNFTTSVVPCPPGMLYNTNFLACAMTSGTNHCPDQRPGAEKYEIYCPRLISGEDYTITAELHEFPSFCYHDVNVTLLYNNKELLQCNSASQICNTAVDYSSLGYQGNASVRYLGNNSALQFKFEVLAPMRGGHYNIKWQFCDGILYQHDCQVFSEGLRTECGASSNLCVNVEQCVDGTLGYQCQCLPGYDGIHCNIGDNQVYCYPSLINLPASNATSTCLKPVTTSCYVAGLPSNDPVSLLTLSPKHLSDAYAINKTTVVSDGTVSYTFCLSPDTTPGNLTFYDNISSTLHGDRPFQMGFRIQVSSVNTAPFFSNSSTKPIGQNKVYSFNVLEHSTNQSAVICVNKTNDRNGTCDAQSDCVQVVDVDKDKKYGIESLRLTVKLKQGRAVIQFKNDSSPRSFGCFHVIDSLSPTALTFDLTVTDGGNDTVSSTVQFNIIDENDPPNCYVTPDDLGGIDISAGNQSVATIECSDPDVDEMFQRITFVIDRPYQRYFDVSEDRHLQIYSSLKDLTTGRHAFNITATGYSASVDAAYVTNLTVTFVVTDMVCPPLLANEGYVLTTELHTFTRKCYGGFNVTLLYDDKEILHCDLETADSCQYSTEFEQEYVNVSTAKLQFLGNSSGLQFMFESLVPVQEGFYTVRWGFCDGSDTHTLCRIKHGDPIDECTLGNPCVNATQCTDKPIGYTCDCIPGFDGQNCDVGDYQLYCDTSRVPLPPSKPTNTCFPPTTVNCYVAGLTTEEPLSISAIATTSPMSYGVTDNTSLADDSVTFTLCLTPDSLEGEHSINYTISSSAYGDKPVQVEFIVNVVSVNTAPFFTVGQNMTFTFNVSEHTANQSAVLCVNKTGNRNQSCDGFSRCVLIVDVDRNVSYGAESLKLAVKFKGQGQQVIQFKNETSSGSFGCFHAQGRLIPKSMFYNLTVTDGGNDSVTSTVQFNIIDENDPPQCSLTPGDLGDIDTSAGNQSVATIECIDPDVDEKLQQVTFAVDLPYQKYFDVSEDRHLQIYSSLKDLPTGRHAFNITATGYSASVDAAYVTNLTVTFVVTDMVCPPLLANEGYVLTTELHTFPRKCHDGFNVTLLYDDKEILHCDLETESCPYSTEFEQHYANVSTGKVQLLGNSSGLQFMFESTVPVQEGLYAVRWEFCDGSDTHTLCHIKKGDPIDECALGSPCVNATQCTDKPVGYTCDCSPGYGGQNCDVGDYQLYCDSSHVPLPPSKPANTCFPPTTVSCYVAGLTTQEPLSISAVAAIPPSSYGITDDISLADDSVTFTLCLTPDSLEGEHSIDYNISSAAYGDRPVQVEFIVNVVSVNTAPFFSVGQNITHTFNVSEHTANQSVVVCINKTGNRNQSCDVGSRCVLIVDVDRNVSYGAESLKLAVKLKGQGQQGILFKSETNPESFGCFYVLGRLNPTSIYYNLTVTDGGNASVTSGLQFTILDENDPPNCYNTQISLGDIDINVDNQDMTYINCSDPDFEEQLKQIKFSVEQPYNKYFRVSSSRMLQVYGSLKGLMLGSHTFNITATGYSTSIDAAYVTNITVTIVLTDWMHLFHLIVRKCPEEYVQEEITFQSTPIGETYAVPCPKDYIGLISRHCSLEMTWEAYNLNNCTREVLISALDLVSALEDPDMSSEEAAERVENATVIVINSLVANPVIVSGDIKNILNVFMSVRDASKHKDAAVNPLTLQNFADISDKLLAANETSWSDLEHEEANYGSVLLDSLDTIVTTSLKSLNEKESITVKDNIVIGRYIGFEGIQFPGQDANQTTYGWALPADNKVYLPKDAFDGPVNYSIIVYRNLASKIIINNTLQERNGEKILINKVFNSDIISISTSETSIRQPIQLTFLLTETNLSNPVCAFLSTSPSVSDMGLWSTRGCMVVTSNKTHIICSCDHLTSFAVLMSPFSSPDDSFVISLISQIGCGISIFCLLLTVVVYGVMWRYVRNDRSVLHINLCLCLIIGYVVFLAGVDQTDSEVGCKVVAAFLHYFFLVVFFTMLAEGIEILKSVWIVFLSKTILPVLLLVAYGVPLVIVAVSLGITRTNGYGTLKYCWLSLDGGLFWAFVGPVLLVFLVNLIILIVVIKVMQTSHWMKEKKKRSRVMSVIRSICVLFPLMGLTWIFGVLSVNHDTVVFQYLFAIFNSLQGLFIFIFHCLLHYQIRDGFKAMKNQRKSVVTSMRTSTTDTGRRTSNSTSFKAKSYKRRLTSTSPEHLESSIGLSRTKDEEKLGGDAAVSRREEPSAYSDKEEESEFNSENGVGHRNGIDAVDAGRRPRSNEHSEISESTPILIKTAGEPQGTGVENLGFVNPMFETNNDSKGRAKQSDKLDTVEIKL
ncbi:unnamed protein product [Lymnaea stagnalis]|uniref:Uncharacterized protein n=1 Tax=Lymnaea stagnalis TaxID=6523 RepID=A0AAV2I370_LYMST